MHFIDKPAKWNVLKKSRSQGVEESVPLRGKNPVTWLPLLGMGDLVGAKAS
jgi:hypothetical protein